MLRTLLAGLLCIVAQAGSGNIPAQPIAALVREPFAGTSGSALARARFSYQLGGFTERRYNSRGQPVYQLTPDGKRICWRYYLDGRSRTNFLSNGAYQLVVCDDANRRATTVFYSSNSVLLSTNLAEKDRRGNVIRTVDEGGFVSTNLFDGLDRPRIAAGPAILTQLVKMDFTLTTNIVQELTTTYYGLAELAVTNINAVGEKKITYADAARRPTRSEIRTASDTLIREQSFLYSQDHHSVTVTNGSGANAIVTTDYGDNAGHAVLSVAYPVAGNASIFSFMLHRFDISGNEIASRQCSMTNGNLTVWSTNGATFDGMHRPLTQTVRDGASTTNTYNAAGQKLSSALPGGVVWHAGYNNGGQKLLDYDSGSGGAITRSNAFLYFGTNSPFAGLLATNFDGRTVTNVCAYDDWLRPTTNTSTGPLPEQNSTSIVKFDVRGLGTNLTESFASTNTGPTTTIIRTYDAYRQVLTEKVQIGTNIFSNEAQGWDSAGRRGGFTINGFGQNFTYQADGMMTKLQGPTGTGNYSYTSGGLLLNRTLKKPSGDTVRYTAILSRDGMGHPLGITNTLPIGTNVGEALSWRGDGFIAAHSVIMSSNWTDNRTYVYANLSRKLIEEHRDLDSAHHWTNTLTVDKGQAGGPGVITKMAETGGGNSTWSAALDSFSRAATETNNTVHRPAWGTNNGLSASVTITVDGKPMPVSMTDTNNLQWRAMLELTPGSHQLVAAALHPSTIFTAYATNTITASATNFDTVTVTSDGDGNVTNRTWKSTGYTNTQTIIYDAHRRLEKVIARDSAGNGRNFSAIYDLLGRLLEIIDVPVVNSVTNTGETHVVQNYFDPQVEFLILGTTEDGATTWKVIGPDFDGRYGGQNGTGGFEAIVPGPELFCPIIGDYFGNLLLINDATHGGVIYYASRPTAFGTVPGCTPVPIGQRGADLGAKCIWRNREFTSIGYFWMGGNWYQPDGLRFLGMDALGHDGNRADGYGICGFSPLVDWDADGRCASRLWNNAVNWAERTYANGVATMEGVIDPQTRAQTLMDSGSGGVRGAFNWGVETAEGINNLVSGRITGYFNNLALNYVSEQGNALVNYVSSASGANPDSPAGQFTDSSTRVALTFGSMLFGSGEAKIASEGQRMLASGERLLLGGEPGAAEGGIQFASTTGGDPAFLLNASKATPVPGILDVAVHGAPMSVDVGANSVNWRVLASLIERNPEFTGQDIRLLSCKTGSLPDGFAQNLGNKLGVSVSAPNDTIWAFPSGRLTIGPLPNANSGSFITFPPGGGRP